MLLSVILISDCVAGGSHHKHIVIHVPLRVKHHHHTHTVYKHIKHHPYKFFDHGYDFGGHDWSAGDFGSNGFGDVSGYDGGYDHNDFGSFGWDDK